MKRSLAISLIMILMINALGYYGVFLQLHYEHDLAMMQALDSDNYDKAFTVVIKVPVSIPYMSDQQDFERVNGDFEYQGEFYRMVKQRYAKDTLTIVCIKDTGHEKIDKALADYVKSYTDQATDGGQAAKVPVKFLKDYLSIIFSIASASTGWTTSILYNFSYKPLRATFVTNIVHPPERL